MSFEQYYNKTENVLSNRYFLVFYQKNAEVQKVLLRRRIRNVCN